MTRVRRRQVDAVPRRVALAATVLVLLLLMAAPAWAAREVRVGMYSNASLVSLDARSRPVGLHIDVVKQIATRHGWHLRPPA